MKRSAFPGFIFSLIFSLLPMCTSDPEDENNTSDRINIETLTFVHSMKGWEIYSWPAGDDWNYSVLIGTNRLKTYNEVTTTTIIVTGKDTLKMVLNKFPENEFISWKGPGWLERCWGGNYGDLSLPDSATVSEIKAYCLQKNLVLQVTD
jgi:hypothetical protein